MSLVKHADPFEEERPVVTCSETKSDCTKQKHGALCARRVAETPAMFKYSIALYDLLVYGKLPA